jgi:hypothetical protein
MAMPEDAAEAIVEESMYSDAFGYDPALPEDIRKMFMWLYQDVAALHSKWIFYVELFSSEENTGLMSELARSSFHIIEESLRSDMTISICRLRDQVEYGRHRRLSLRTLVQHCGGIGNVDELLRDFLEACEPVHQYRNRRIAHNDLATTIEPHDNPLPGIGRGQIDRILELASAILNTIYQNYVDSELAFAHPMLIGGADALIHYLKAAKEHLSEIPRNRPD